MGTFIAGSCSVNLVLCCREQAYQNEKRQEQGIAAAKARGVRFGKPPTSGGELPQRIPAVAGQKNHRRGSSQRTRDAVVNFPKQSHSLPRCRLIEKVTRFAKRYIFCWERSKCYMQNTSSWSRIKRTGD